MRRAALALILVSLTALVLAAQSSAATQAIYQVGDKGPAGGIVFYDKGNASGGWRYLEVATSDAGSGIPWDTGNYLDVTTSTTIGSGKANTDAIIEALGSGIYAAQLCHDLTTGGFNDWFLPSKDELNLLYTAVDWRGRGSFTDKDREGFTNHYYWSSSQYFSSYFYAWDQDFGNGRQKNDLKNTGFSVRAIRAF